jgi:hypothetical protein
MATADLGAMEMGGFSFSPLIERRIACAEQDTVSLGKSTKAGFCGHFFGWERGCGGGGCEAGDRGHGQDVSNDSRAYDWDH